MSKISVVIEEADETLFWLEALSENAIVASSLIERLRHEGEELLKILTSSQRTARQRGRLS